MFTQPWHSTKESVYHVCTNCEDGKRIDPQQKWLGDGSKPLCERCNQLLRANGC